MKDNQQQIAGSYLNTCSFARSDMNWTDFVCVPKEDIVAMNSVSTKGFKTNENGQLIDTDYGTYALQSPYRSGSYVPAGWTAASPVGGGRCNACSTCQFDCRRYFYKGVGASDVISYVTCLGIV